MRAWGEEAAAMWSAAVLMAVCGVGGEARRGVVGVDIRDFAFSPAEVTVEQHSTVRWTNFDGVDHTATSQTGPGTLAPSGVFDSGPLLEAEVFEHRFDEPGVFFYYCVPHGSAMQGVVRVKAVCAGDVNGDGAVDFADLNALLEAFNGVGEGLAADVDRDGDVDFGDLNLLLGVFNTSCAAR